MTAVVTNTWEDSPARRPSLADVGGADHVGDPDNLPPGDGTELMPETPNQQNRQLESMGAVVSPARITIGVGGGGPFIDKLETANKNLSVSDFTFTPVSAGNHTIDWLSSILPPMLCEPVGSTNGSTGVGAIDIKRESASPGHTKIRVRTWDAGVATDLRCTIHL